MYRAGRINFPLFYVDRDWLGGVFVKRSPSALRAPPPNPKNRIRQLADCQILDLGEAGGGQPLPRFSCTRSLGIRGSRCWAAFFYRNQATNRTTNSGLLLEMPTFSNDALYSCRDSQYGFRMHIAVNLLLSTSKPNCW